ncbi:hypothetical protein [Nocardioides sambongensis]|uniref:hypothetical protein n=1 Tax=Nocardioides sambongensis TaxID=2589074 RepID=UPI00112DB6DE|nr:hypothetical protein [Nocardioides sambongensis]
MSATTSVPHRTQTDRSERTPVTVVHYFYRDGDNNKQGRYVELLGALSVEQSAQVKAALDLGYRFVPDQIGWPHLGVDAWDSFPGEVDHPWHEIELDDVLITTTREPLARESVDDWVTSVVEAAATGWKPEDHSVEQYSRKA